MVKYFRNRDALSLVHPLVNQKDSKAGENLIQTPLTDLS